MNHLFGTRSESMPLNINTNVSSLNAQRYLNANSAMLSSSMEKLSSGYRINRAGDDAAGLALSEKLRSQIRGSQKAQDNVQDGINVLNIADGAMQSVTDNLQRMRELAVQAGNDTYNTAQRSSMKAEFNQLASGINQIAASTEFNGVKLMTGATTSMKLQIGANSVSGVDTIDLEASNVFKTATATALGVTSSLSLDSNSSALATITALDGAISTINTRRGAIGALSNRLETTATNLATNVENTSASESRIRNVDVASESAKMSQYQILQQAAAAMLTQANQAPQLALQLLKG
jgi:flagellin